jgi:hypothetical protein
MTFNLVIVSENNLQLVNQPDSLRGVSEWQQTKPNNMTGKGIHVESIPD